MQVVGLLSTQEQADEIITIAKFSAVATRARRLGKWAKVQQQTYDEMNKAIDTITNKKRH